MWIDGEKIRNKRLDLGLTQTELGSGICTQATISHIENRNHVPRVKTAQLVCKRLNLILDDNLLLKTNDDYHENITACFSLYLLRKPVKLRQKLEQIKYSKLKDPYLISQYYLMIAYLEYCTRKYEASYRATLLAQEQLSKHPHAYFELIVLVNLMVISSKKKDDKKVVTYGQLAYNLAIKLTPTSANESTVLTNSLYDIAEVYQLWNYDNLALKIINLIIKNHRAYLLELSVYGKACIMKSYLAKSKQTAVNHLMMGCLIGVSSTNNQFKKNNKKIIEQLLNKEITLSELHDMLNEQKILFNSLK